MPLDTIRSIAARPDIRQFLSFVIIGIIATVIHYSVLIIGVEILHAAVVAASTAGYLISLGANYMLNRTFTFQSGASVRSTAPKYFLLYTAGMLLNAAVLWAVMQLGAMYILAQVVATGTVMFWNFFGAKFFVFRT